MALGMINGFAPTNNKIPFNHPILGDMSDGGIIAKPDNKPKGPWVCEERPTTIDWKTGERVYVDELLKNKPNICYFA